MPDTAESLAITCCITGESKDTEPLADGSPKLPMGWKRLAGKTYSPAGWEQTFCLRSVHIPVASVVEAYDPPDWSVERCKDGWKAFRLALKTSWAQATQIANWTLTEVAKADSAPLEDGPKGKKLPKMPKLENVYALARALYPDLDSQSTGSLVQKVRAKYREVRWDLRIRAAVTLPTYRYPTPIPVPAKDSAFHVNEQHQPFMRLRIAGQRFTVRLRNGFEFARQIRSLEKVQAGDGAQGEASLFQKRDGQIMVAISCWLPKEKARRTDKTLRVSTRKDRVFEVVLDGREQPWMLNEDHLTRRHLAHRNRMQRLREDLKFERRRPKRNATDIAEFREKLCDRQHRIVNDFCHKAAAMVLGWARRNQVGTIEFDGTEKHQIAPNFKLKTLVQQKANEAGITFVDVTTSDESNGQMLD